MSANLAALLYLLSGILFILALRGLSSPETARQGNFFGMAGMAIAIVTSLLAAQLDPASIALIVGGVMVGGGIGAVIARRISMTSMPQLVAAFHSLVGMAAVLVAAAALFAPEAFGIADPVTGHLHKLSLFELSIGTAIGAITFSGSVIAFAKLNGNMSGAPILLPMRHAINIALGVFIAVMIAFLMASGGEAKAAFWLIALAAFIIGVTLIIPIGGADMPVVVSMLNSYSGWAAAALGFTLENTALLVTGALVGSSFSVASAMMGARRLSPDRKAMPNRARRKTPLSCSRMPARSSSCPAMAWQSPRPSTR